jgi:hypothetical protein
MPETSGVHFSAVPTIAERKIPWEMDEWGIERPEHTTAYCERKCELGGWRDVAQHKLRE